MQIRIADFKGQIPRMHPRLLPPNFAQVATNTRLEDGAIGPVSAPVTVHTFPTTPQAFIRFNGAFQAFTQPNVSATVGPVAQDRLYYTGDGFPKVSVGGTVYDLAVNPPQNPPTISVQRAPNGTPAEELAQLETQETITYVYTYVTAFGEESAPSPPSAIETVNRDDTMTVGVLAPLQTGRNITKINIYRSRTSLSGITDFYFLRQINAVTQDITDTLVNQLGETLPSADFDLPEPTMLGLISLPNGMMAAHAGRELMFCHPFQPHAWPVKYRLTTESRIVGLGAFGAFVAVLSEGAPYLVQGTDPSIMVMEKLENTLPCVSAFSIVDIGYSIAYASHEGLVIISQNGAEVVTKPLFTPEQWRKMRPETIRAAQVNGRYAFSYQPVVGGPRRFGIIDLSGEQPFYMEAGIAPTVLHYSAADSALYYVEGNGVVRQWDPLTSNTLLRQTWRSKRHVLPSPENFGALLVECDALDGVKQTPADPDCVVRIFAGGVLRHTTSVVNAPTRLPSGFLADTWEIEVEGYLPVTAISLAGDISELTEA